MKWRASIACALGCVAAACGSASPTTPAAGTLQGVALVGMPTAFSPGEIAQLSARATYSDGRVDTVTTQARWSTRTLACSVDATGSLTALAPGDCLVDVSFDAKTAAGTVQVSQSAVFAISGVVRQMYAVNEAPLAGATVTLMSGPQAGRQASVGADGAFTFSGVPRGAVSLRATAAGYEAATASVTPENPSIDLLLAPPFVVEQASLVFPFGAGDFYHVVRIPFTLTHRGPVTVRLVSNQRHCEVSYGQVFGASVLKPDGSQLPVAICPSGGDSGPHSRERSEIMEPGDYVFTVSIMKYSSQPTEWREYFLSYPR